jgi:TonB family protein
MTSALVESRPWPRRRWWGLVALIFGVQLGVIFWLGDTSPVRPRPAAPVFTLKLAGSASAELLALNDPTLFALPHRQESAGSAALETPRPESPSFQWPEPTNSLLLAVDQLGAVFNRFIQTNEFNSLQVPANPMPPLTLPNLPPLAISAEQSTLLLEGDLAQRRLITPLPLRSWTNLDILTNSVVRIGVDAAGTPESLTLRSGSGSSEADRYAIELARAARFEPLRRNRADTAFHPAAELSWGSMIFRWHTVPPPPANTPAATP